MSLWAVITRIDDWLHAHNRAIAGLSVAAFVLSCASYAGFLALPELWQLPASLAWLVPALRYGAWDVIVTPKLRERRTAMMQGKDL